MHACTRTHTHTTILQLYGFCPGQSGWAGTRRNIHPLTPIVVICFLHLLRSMAFCIFNPRALQSFSTISLQVFFGLPLGPAPSTSYSKHFFTQSLSSFCSIFPYHYNLFCCSTEIMSSNPSLSLNPLLGTLSGSLTPHIRLIILISAPWSATLFSFLKGQVSLPCNILLHIQLLYNLPLTINDISLLVSNGTNCLNLFHPIQIMVSTAAWASPSTLNMAPLLLPQNCLIYRTGIW